MVCAAMRALITDSSVASVTAAKKGSMWLPGNMSTFVTLAFFICSSLGVDTPTSPLLAVENAMEISPDRSSPMEPVLARPCVARFASRANWCGRNGASVAMVMISSPALDRVSGQAPPVLVLVHSCRWPLPT
jgi:hypothetical protein